MSLRALAAKASQGTAQFSGDDRERGLLTPAIYHGL
jgi:hypothetical protein